MIKEIRTDNAKEFTSKAFQKLMADRGIRHTITVPYSPQMLSRNERSHSTIFSRVRAMLSGMDRRLWAEATNHEVFVQNATVHSTLRQVPATLAGMEVDIKPYINSGLRFGCEVFVWKKPLKSAQGFSKHLQDRAIKGIFVGMESSRIARVIQPGDMRRVIRSRIEEVVPIVQEDRSIIFEEYTYDGGDKDGNPDAKSDEEVPRMPRTGENPLADDNDRQHIPQEDPQGDDAEEMQGTPENTNPVTRQGRRNKTTTRTGTTGSSKIHAGDQIVRGT